MTLNVNYLLCYQSCACFDQTPEARITWFRYKVALYLSYLHIKFDDKTEGNFFEFQVYFLIRLCRKVKLTSRFGFICSQDFADTETCNTNLWQQPNV